MKNFDAMQIFCLICFGILTVYYFVKWLYEYLHREDTDMNTWLGWACAFMWCLMS